MHKRILPKLLFDDPAIDNISNLPCVKKGPSVIILSSGKNNSDEKEEKHKSRALGKCFHKERPPNDSLENDHSAQLARKKLTTIINRVKIDREKENLKDDNNNRANSNSPNPHVQNGSTVTESKLNVANVRSAGKTIYLSPTKSTDTAGSDLYDGKLVANGKTIENGSSKNGHVKFDDENINRTKTTVRVSKRLAHSIEHPLPYANHNKADLTCVQLGRRRVYRFVMSPWFEVGVTIFILLNTICLAIEYHDMDETFRQGLNYANHVSK